MSENNAGSAAESTGTAQAQFGIQRIYVKDVSFESPNAPAIFAGAWEPQADINVSTNAQSLGNDLYEVVLGVTATVKVRDQVAFLVEVTEAGVFQITGVPGEQMGPLLGSFCPNVLFPYAREVVSDLVTKGGFPQLLLNPVNFDLLYQQQVAQQNAGGAGA